MPIHWLLRWYSIHQWPSGKVTSRWQCCVKSPAPFLTSTIEKKWSLTNTNYCNFDCLPLLCDPDWKWVGLLLDARQIHIVSRSWVAPRAVRVNTLHKGLLRWSWTRHDGRQPLQPVGYRDETMAVTWSSGWSVEPFRTGLILVCHIV